MSSRAAAADDGDAALRGVISSPERSAADRRRDADRHPYETLRFFGLQPSQRVIEIAPGGGWYTQILAPYLRGQGRYAAAIYVEDEAKRAAAEARFAAKFGGDAARYGRVAIGGLGPAGLSGVGAPGEADLVLTFRNVHNWIAAGHLDEALAAFHAALRPGGVLGVEEHRALPGTTLAQMTESGYVREDWFVARARAAGFQLAAASEINANPRDDRVHPDGVWSLPPTLRGGEADRAKYLAIGESDRMTLKFVKAG